MQFVSGKAEAVEAESCATAVEAAAKVDSRLEEGCVLGSDSEAKEGGGESCVGFFFWLVGEADVEVR